MVLKNICLLVNWTKVASALEGLMLHWYTSRTGRGRKVGIPLEASTATPEQYTYTQLLLAAARMLTAMKMLVIHCRTGQGSHSLRSLSICPIVTCLMGAGYLLLLPILWEQDISYCCLSYGSRISPIVAYLMGAGYLLLLPVLWEQDISYCYLSCGSRISPIVAYLMGAGYL